MFEQKVWDMLRTRCAIISANDEAGPFTTRLYVDKGETATLTVKKAKTFTGARRQASAMLIYKPEARKQELVDLRKQEAVDDIQVVLAKISEWVDSEKCRTLADWGHIGDLNHILEELQEIEKFIG